MFDVKLGSEVDETTLYREQAVQAGLARLLAMENLFVQFRNIHTATMNVQTRVLTIPIFSRKLSKSTVTMLVGHEVGHALFSPLLDASHFHDGLNKYGRALKSYINVVEDARIERMIQLKYPGLRKDFSAGYKELYDTGFFGEIYDLGSMYLVDRVNLYFKVGPQLGNFMFTEDEMALVMDIAKATSFDDVVALSQRMYSFDKARRQAERALEQEAGKQKPERPQREQPEQPEEQHEEQLPDGSGGSFDVEPDEDMDDLSPNQDDEEEGTESEGRTAEADDFNKEDESSDGDETNDDEGDEGSDENSSTGETLPSVEADEPLNDELGQGAKESDETGANTEKVDADLDDEMVSATDEAFREQEGSLVDVAPVSDDPQYFRIDMPHYNDKVISYKAILKSAEGQGTRLSNEIRKDVAQLAPKHTYEEYMLQSKAAFRLRFTEKHNRHINHLVREFDLKKNAWQQARAQTANVGTINMNRIWMYQFADDVFNKTVNVPKGKNHGMAMFVDFSGSMDKIVQSVLEQAFVMAMFCRRVGIACRIYGFTNDYNVNAAKALEGVTAGNKRIIGQTLSYQVNGHVTIGDISLAELVHERMSNKEFSDMMFWFCNKPSHQSKNPIKAQAFSNHGRGKKMAMPFSAMPTWTWMEYYSGLISTGGTPLHETILLAGQVVEEMKVGSNIENMNVMFLTDGDGGNLQVFNDEGSAIYDYSYRAGKQPAKYFLSPFSGKAYRVSDSEVTFRTNDRSGGHMHRNEMRQIINMVKDHYGCTMIGYNLIGSYAAHSYLRKYDGFYSTPKDDLQASFEKHGYFGVDGAGFDQYFLLNTANLDRKDEVVDGLAAPVAGDDAAAATLASAFTEMSQKNAGNRQFLRKFVELIA
jgi:hypothetical protein